MSLMYISEITIFIKVIQYSTASFNNLQFASFSNSARSNGLKKLRNWSSKCCFFLLVSAIYGMLSLSLTLYFTNFNQIKSYFWGHFMIFNKYSNNACIKASHACSMISLHAIVFHTSEQAIVFDSPSANTYAKYG